MERISDSLQVAVEGGALMPVRKGGLDNVIAASKENIKQKDSSSSTKRGLRLEQISDRPHGDTRLLNSEHVQELADNIAAVGLIQTLAVDSEGHLLAGGHRRAALTLLEQTDPKRFTELFPRGEVPVRVFDFNATDDPERAIAIEAAENEQRRDYTPAEVRELADRLIKAGYRNTKGKPRKGQKALTPALMTIVGKSKATVKRYLAGEDKGSNEPLSSQDKQRKLESMVLALLEKLELSEHTDEYVAGLSAQLREALVKSPQNFASKESSSRG